MKCEICGKEYPSEAFFKMDSICNDCYLKLRPDEKPDEPVAVTQTMSEEDYLSNIYNRLNEIENNLPDSNIINHRFWPRAWAVTGHLIVASLVLGISLFFITFILSLLRSTVFQH